MLFNFIYIWKPLQICWRNGPPARVEGLWIIIPNSSLVSFPCDGPYIVLLGLWCGYYHGYGCYYGLFSHSLLILSFQPYEMRLHGWCALPVYMQVPLISQSLWAPSGHIFTDPHDLFSISHLLRPWGTHRAGLVYTVKSIVTLRGIFCFISMLFLWPYHPEEVPYLSCLF